MGCFNHKGNFSQLPIAYGDRIVIMVGFSELKRGDDTFSPGCSFVPISVPIRGEYNDYGGIENVDRTPAIEVLEKYFGMNVETIVNIAERTMSGCEDQMENENEKVKEILKNIASQSGYPNRKFTLSYIMEHEHIFDYLISTADVKKKDRLFWRIPHRYIEALGYKKNLLGKENAYEIIKWEHDTLPALRENCYVWVENEYGDLGKVSHSFAELCSRIGCDVPKEFEESFFESVFKKEAAPLNPEEKDSMLIEFFKGIVGKIGKDGEPITKEDSDEVIKKFLEKTPEERLAEYELLDFIIKEDDENYSFRRYTSSFGLFYFREGMCMNNCILAQFGDGDEHLDLKYMKEVVETAAIIDALQNLQMTWGVTNYYRQDVDYDQHIDFLNECLNVAKEKKKEHDYEEE